MTRQQQQQGSELVHSKVTAQDVLTTVSGNDRLNMTSFTSNAQQIYSQKIRSIRISLSDSPSLILVSGS